MAFFLITGTSKGIGEALAQKIVSEGHTVLGISRNRPERLNSANYYHLSFDLSDTSRASVIVEKINQIVDDQGFDFVCLVNNASMIEPLGPIEKCPPPEIEAHITVGLIAPMILTSLFIGKFADARIRKKIAFISSGAAVRPIIEASCYSSAKAGMLMFTQSVGIEQKDREFGFEVITIGVGMVDTAMQQTIRSKTAGEFAMADYFKRAFKDGQLEERGKAAEKIYTILGNTYEQGKIVHTTDV